MSSKSSLDLHSTSNLPHIDSCTPKNTGKLNKKKVTWDTSSRDIPSEVAQQLKTTPPQTSLLAHTSSAPTDDGLPWSPNFYADTYCPSVKKKPPTNRSLSTSWIDFVTSSDD